MSIIIDISKWIIRNIFVITIAVFILIYLQWFRLTPLVFDHYNDPNEAYIGGLVVLSIYILFITSTKLGKQGCSVKSILGLFAFLFLCINIIYVFFFMPRLTATATCSGKSYYISSNIGTLTSFWSYDQLTVWENMLSYKSHFFGYGGRGYQIICDEEIRETNIVKVSNGVLVYTDGDKPRHYDEYTGLILQDHRYFLSRECNDWVPSTCGSETYTLHQCNLEIKSCKPLPIHYTAKYTEFLVLESSNEVSNEIILYDGLADDINRKLIFTYGENPRCHVEGCEILDETK